MKNSYINLLEDILTYLRLHNKVLYDRLSDMLIEIYEEKEKRNKYKLEKITEKRKENKEYGGHQKDRYKKKKSKVQ